MNNPLPGVPRIESPFFDRFFNETDTDPETLRVARDLREKGYAVVDFREPDLDAIFAQIRRDLEPGFDIARWRTEGWKRGEGLRLQDAWRSNGAVKRLALNGPIMTLIERLYGRPCFAFQTLNFPVGTQQHFHTDAIFFNSMPERFMCGVWLAFEDMGEDNGPLLYYPGSHKLPIYANEHIGRRAYGDDNTKIQHDLALMWEEVVKAVGLQPDRFLARKGQALIWVANLLHGGSRHLDPQRTRWSQVSHYYFDDCAYYTPVESDPACGSVMFREPFNVATGEKVKNRYVGDVIPEAYVIASVPRPGHPPDYQAQAAPVGAGSAGLARAVRRWLEPILGAEFDPKAYLAANPDIAKAGIDPKTHYQQFGRAEGRKLRP